MFHQPVFKKITSTGLNSLRQLKRVLKFNLIFHDSTPQNFFSKHKNKTEFKCLDDVEVLSSDFSGLKNLCSLNDLSGLRSLNGLNDLDSIISLKNLLIPMV